MANIIVLGAGVIGASIAANLAGDGHRVQIIDRKAAGVLTASEVSFACINSNNKSPIGYHALNVAGMAAHHALARTLGHPSWYRLEGTYEWRTGSYRESHLARVERLRNAAYPAEWVEAGQLVERAPLLNRAAMADAPVAFYGDEGWVETGEYIRHALDIAARHGAELLLTEDAPILILDGKRIAGVTVAGKDYRADLVVNATGAAVNEVTGETALHLPMSSTPGMTIVTEPVAGRFGTMIRSDIAAVRPAPNGGLMLHSLSADKQVGATADDPKTLQAAENVISRIQHYLQPGTTLRIAEIRVTRRPMTADTYPAVGPIPGWSNYLVAVSHSGVTLAPVIAGAIAKLAAGRPLPTLFADYAPARFFSI